MLVALGNGFHYHFPHRCCQTGSRLCWLRTFLAKAVSDLQVKLSQKYREVSLVLQLILARQFWLPAPFKNWNIDTLLSIVQREIYLLLFLGKCHLVLIFFFFFFFFEEPDIFGRQTKKAQMSHFLLFFPTKRQLLSIFSSLVWNMTKWPTKREWGRFQWSKIYISVRRTKYDWPHVACDKHWPSGTMQFIHEENVFLQNGTKQKCTRGIRGKFDDKYHCLWTVCVGCGCM